MKKLRTVICMVLLCVLSVLPVSAAQPEMSMGFVAGITQDNQSTYEFKTWKSTINDGYYLTLPAYLEDETVVVNGLVGNVSLDGAVLKNGMEITAPAKGVHTVVMNGAEYQLEVLYGSDIATICITTESGSLEDVYADKSHKESGTIAIFDKNTTQYNGGLDYIKGRGNATWEYDKRPFNIKLDEKADLFEMGKNKSWTLLANWTDITGLKNKLIIDLADKAGLEYNGKSVFADLYVNGEYLGLYTLIEKVEIGETRVDIANLEDLNEEANPDIDVEECTPNGEPTAQPNTMKYVEIPNNPEDITGGYLLEFEMYHRYPDEASGFVSAYGQSVVVKSPEFASKEQVEYISNYYQEMEYAILSDDGRNTLGKHYSEYLDEDSMVKVTLISEISKNLDTAASSYYFYKDVDGKLYAGPMWDYDMSLGVKYERDGVDFSDPTGLWASSRLRYELTGYSLPALLNQKEDFRYKQAKAWNEIIMPMMDEFKQEIDTLAAKTEASAKSNALKWAYGEKHGDVEPLAYYEEELARLKDFVDKRVEYLDDFFAEDRYYICYRSNGASGEMLDINCYKEGDTAEVMYSQFLWDDKPFLGWNTKPNGRGVAYEAAEQVEMDETLVLYAQWNEPSTINKIRSMIATFFK